MFDQTIEHKAHHSLSRLLPRLENHFREQIEEKPIDWQIFLARLENNFVNLFSIYLKLYESQYDFFFHLENLLCSLARMWFERPDELKSLDNLREKDPLWFHSNQMLGGVCYVDLFAVDLR